MASQVRIQVSLISDGVQALLNSAGVQGVCKDAAERIRSKAGKGYRVAGPYHPGSRVMFRVYPRDTAALLAEAKDKKLSRAYSSCKVRGR